MVVVGGAVVAGSGVVVGGAVVGGVVVVVGATVVVVVGVTVVVVDTTVVVVALPEPLLHEYLRRVMTHCEPGSTFTEPHAVGHPLANVRGTSSEIRLHSTGPLDANRQPDGHFGAKC